MPKNTIGVWFDRHAEEAARFYAASFPDSHVTEVELTVAGIPCLGLNGGPAFPHTEACSFQIATERRGARRGPLALAALRSGEGLSSAGILLHLAAQSERLSPQDHAGASRVTVATVQPHVHVANQIARDLPNAVCAAGAAELANRLAAIEAWLADRG